MTKPQQVQHLIDDHNNNPWSMYQKIHSITYFAIHHITIEQVEQKLRRDSIQAYHKEEAANGNI